jgi:hypothetical protein
MINLKLLNEIPRPEGWGEWRDSGYFPAIYNHQENRTMWWCAASRQLRCSLSGGTASDLPSGFDACRTYLETGWLPIETAPADGTMIDILDDGKRVADAMFDYYDGWVTDRCCDYAPTHWRPLPPLPEGA